MGRIVCFFDSRKSLVFFNFLLFVKNFIEIIDV